MKNNNNELRGTPWVARQLESWIPSDSPDLILATTQYVAKEWLDERETPSQAVYSIYAAARDLGARGDGEAAVIACALQALLEQQGCLAQSFSHVRSLRRRRGDLIGRHQH
jgi:hypothetical protein